MEKVICFLLIIGVFQAGAQSNGCSTPATINGSVAGTFQTANPYGNYAACRWTISASPGKAVQLEFSGRFDIEFQGACSYDKVVIYDSAAADQILKTSPCSATSLANANKFGPFCGFSAPDTIVASGNKLVVEFCTDSSGTGSGFEISYKEISEPAPPPTGRACNETVVVDGKHHVTFYDSSEYPSYLDCRYTYTSKNGKALKVTSSRFALEGTIGCRYDNMKIYDGKTSAGVPLGTFCGTNGPKDIRSSGSSLFLAFRSDQYTNGKGFSLTIEESCSGNHLCSESVVNSPDVCYEDNQICDGDADCPLGEDESFCGSDCGDFSQWKPGQPFPGAAAITHIDGQIHCGAALINAQYVITTAHCFHRLDDKPDRFVVKLGAAKLADAYVARIDKIVIHPQFNPKTLANNLALVKLKKHVPTQLTIAPFCYPSTADAANIAEGTVCYTLGWGRTNANSITSYASSVKQFTATILNNSNSKCKFSASPVVVDGNSICASTSGALCYGDNGAPLACKTKNGKWQISGVNSVSFGCTGSSSTPSIFTKVSAYSSWIVQTAFSKKEDL